MVLLKLCRNLTSLSRILGLSGLQQYKLQRRCYRIVKPGNVSQTRPVPEHIVKPQYAVTGTVPSLGSKIEIKTSEQIEGMRQACQLAKDILQKAGQSLKAGMTTDDIDKLVHEETIANNAYPSPLLYKGFPKSVCTSVNYVVCHGIPDDLHLEDGDILNIDVTVYLNGYHGDTSATFAVGTVDVEAQTLMDVGKVCLELGISVCKPGARFCDIGEIIGDVKTRERVKNKMDNEAQTLMDVGKVCLDLGISVCKPGARFCDIGEIIGEHAYSQGFTVVPQFIGHGIGSYFHGPPSIFHVSYDVHGDTDTLQQMKPGMVFTIEPIISEGSEQFEILSDGWTCVSMDDSRSVQFEHTVLITDSGVDVLTS